MIRNSLAGLCLLLMCAVAPVQAQDEGVAPDFSELEASTDPADADAVRAALAVLEAADPGFWHELHPPGPFRTALARSLAPDAVRQRLDTAAADPDAMAATVRNLVSRHDLGALLSEDERVRPLVEEHHYLLRELAIEDLWEGRRELGIELLGTAEIAQRAAGTLALCAAPEAIRLVADVITGAVPVTPAALAQVARADPTSTNPRHHRPLGAERIAALVAVARTHDDPLLRVLAARVLELASDGDDAAVTAWTAARSPEVEDEAWWLLARHAPGPIPLADVPERAVLSALVGEMAFGYVNAEGDFADAEAAALRLVAVYDSVRDPRARAGILVNLEYLGHKLVVEEFRQHPVPSWRAFLERLRTPRDEDPPLVRELSRRVASRLLASLDHEAVPRGGNRARKTPLPRREPRPAPADWGAALVSAADDPAALLDLAEIYVKRGLELPEPHAEVPAPTEEALPVLRELVDTCPDSRVGRLAAELLIRSPQTDDVLFVLRRGDRLAFDDPGRILWYPDWYPDLNAIESTDDVRTSRICLLSDVNLSPALRAALLEDVRDSLSEIAPGALHESLLTWFETVAPHLDSGLAELALEWAIDDVWHRESWEVAGHEAVRARVRAAIQNVPAKGQRLRLLRLLGAE